MKEFIVDECKPVCDIAYEIGEKLGIKNPEEFSLCSENHEGRSDLQIPSHFM
jgi:hypothetical protein